MGNCTICKRKIEEDCLFTQLCKQCTGQLDLENKIKEEVVEELNKMKGQILSLPNRDDKIGARILMTDGGGVNKFVVTRKIEDLITLIIGEKKHE